MGQHKYNPIAMAAKTGDLPEKSKKRKRWTKRQLDDMFARTMSGKGILPLFSSGFGDNSYNSYYN